MSASASGDHDFMYCTVLYSDRRTDTDLQQETYHVSVDVAVVTTIAS